MMVTPTNMNTTSHTTPANEFSYLPRTAKEARRLEETNGHYLPPQTEFVKARSDAMLLKTELPASAILRRVEKPVPFEDRTISVVLLKVNAHLFEILSESVSVSGDKLEMKLHVLCSYKLFNEEGYFVKYLTAAELIKFCE
jgi:hypothetical protein